MREVSKWLYCILWQFVGNLIQINISFIRYNHLLIYFSPYCKEMTKRAEIEAQDQTIQQEMLELINYIQKLVWPI